MERKPEVSIICNVYNHEKYIKDALEGFVNQKTNFQYEILIHDDASTDRSADIIKEYEVKYPEIVKPIYQSENQYSKRDGTIRRIQGERANGKYIAVCEGDDYWSDPLKLQKQYDFMETHPEYSLCVCSTVWLNMLTGKQETRCIAPEDVDIPIEDIILEKNGRIFQMASVFVKSDIWKNRPMWGFPIGDYPLAIYAALNGKVRMLSDVMCVYRWYSDGSWTARMDDENRRADISRKMIAALEQVNQDTNRLYEKTISQRILKHKYTLALMTRDLDSIRTGDLKQIYDSRGLVHKVSDIVRCKMPGLYLNVRKLIKRTSSK